MVKGPVLVIIHLKIWPEYLSWSEDQADGFSIRGIDKDCPLPKPYRQALGPNQPPTLCLTEPSSKAKNGCSYTPLTRTFL